MCLSNSVTVYLLNLVYVNKILKCVLKFTLFFFRGDYVNALAHYEKGITGDNKVTLNKDKICIVIFEFVVSFL